MSTIPKTRYTPEHYLAVERAAQFRSEFYRGEMFAMVGASRKHNLVAGNVFGELHTYWSKNSPSTPRANGH